MNDPISWPLVAVAAFLWWEASDNDYDRLGMWTTVFRVGSALGLVFALRHSGLLT